MIVGEWAYNKKKTTSYDCPFCRSGATRTRDRLHPMQEC